MKVAILPAILALFGMCIALYVHWKLERETKTKHVFALHFVNILVMVMLYGAAYISSHLVFVDYRQSLGLGIKGILLNSTLFPLPFLVTTYALAAIIFRKSVRAYKREDNSNVVYLRFNWFNRLMRK